VDNLRLFLIRLHAQRGQTMAEYAILLGVIALVILAAALFLGTGLSSIFISTGKRL
jgi:Flp pilus assembly pilin Flp